jgi:predicted  nucleic acid-binding Zn-ribbon protein
MSDLHPLLELQQLDSEVDALHARRAALPEMARVQSAEAERAALAAQRDDLDARIAALAREERRIDGDVADARAKAREVEAQLYSGKVTAVKELEALHAELRSFQERQREHEEAELALMEQEEQLGAERAALDARHATLDRDGAEARTALAAAEAEIDAELARHVAERGAVLARLPADAIATYEKLRSVPRFKGRVVARLEGETCTGCWGALPTAFTSRFAREATDVSSACPRCGRLLLH